MQNYTTQMDAARKGIVTKEMEIVAQKEYRTTEEIRQLVAEGKVAIPANKHHTCLNPEGIGSMLRTKINVNLGVSRDCKDYNIEMQKVMSAVNMGAEAIMDLSSHGNTQPFRQKLTHECPVMIGTVPVYDSVIHYQRDLATLTAQDLSYYDETLGSWYAAPGEYKILLGHSSRDIHATLSVRFSTPRRRPFVIDENTTIGELSKDDRTAAIIQQVLAQAGNALTGGNAGGSEIASSEAVAQMLDSMPLRGIVNFGGPAAAGMITPLLEILRAAIQ